MVSTVPRNTSHRPSGGLTLQFKFLLLPSSVFQCIRITPEGHYLALDDIFDTDRYAENALTNVRDHDFDFQKIMEAARYHPRAQAILTAYEQDILPRLRRAYSYSVTSRRAIAVCPTPEQSLQT